MRNLIEMEYRCKTPALSNKLSRLCNQLSQSRLLLALNVAETRNLLALR